MRQDSLTKICFHFHEQRKKFSFFFLVNFPNGKFGTELHLLVNSFISDPNQATNWEGGGYVRGKLRFVYANIRHFFMRFAIVACN